ncbi:MAG: hypothetical protein FWF13_00850 [Acidobacteria bacterium]|nr:hypothetical protein [Acidobacteriota bacterium]
MNGLARYIIIIIVLLPGLGAAGCGKNVAPAAPEPPAAAEAKYVPAPSAITPPEPGGAAEPAEAPRPEASAPPEIFIEAERNFAAGNYRQAAQDFEKFLYIFPKAPERDRALFYLGFSLALSGDDRDLFQTEAVLRRLIAEFPKSSYRRQAEWILDLKTRIERLQSEVNERDQRIRQLSDELRKLKSIDLERRPSRPE